MTRWRGVYEKRAGRFQAEVSKVFLGYWKSEEEAAVAHDQYAIRIHGKDAHTNFRAEVFSAELRAQLQEISREDLRDRLILKSKEGVHKGSSGYFGVKVRPAGRFSSEVNQHGNPVRVGAFPTALEAAIAHDRKAVEMFGWKARTNRPAIEYMDCMKEEFKEKALKLQALMDAFDALLQDPEKLQRTHRPEMSSKNRGISWDKRKGQWRAVISHAAERRFLGNFVTEEEATRAWDAAALELRGPATKINIPVQGDAMDTAAAAVGPQGGAKKRSRPTPCRKNGTANAAADDEDTQSDEQPDSDDELEAGTAGAGQSRRRSQRLQLGSTDAPTTHSRGQECPAWAADFLSDQSDEEEKSESDMESVSWRADNDSDMEREADVGGNIKDPSLLGATAVEKSIGGGGCVASVSPVAPKQTASQTETDSRRNAPKSHEQSSNDAIRKMAAALAGLQDTAGQDGTTHAPHPSPPVASGASDPSASAADPSSGPARQPKGPRTQHCAPSAAQCAANQRTEHARALEEAAMESGSSMRRSDSAMQDETVPAMGGAAGDHSLVATGTVYTHAADSVHENGTDFHAGGPMHGTLPEAAPTVTTETDSAVVCRVREIVAAATARQSATGPRAVVGAQQTAPAPLQSRQVDRRAEGVSVIVQGPPSTSESAKGDVPRDGGRVDASRKISRACVIMNEQVKVRQRDNEIIRTQASLQSEQAKLRQRDNELQQELNELIRSGMR